MRGGDQQEINDLGVKEWYSKLGGYKLNARVMLANGDIVISTIHNNKTNPNIDMLGWFNQSKIQRETIIKSKRDNETIYDYGAIGDGVLHTIEEWYTAASNNYNPKYKGLADVQADYPFVTDKGFSIDQAAILKLANIRAKTGGGAIDCGCGHFIVKPVNNAEMMLMPAKVTIAGRGDGTIIESITNASDLPNEVVWWDMFLFKGSDTVGGGVRDLTIRQTGGRRINAGVMAQRQGVSRQKFTDIKFESAIASCIVPEGNVTNEVLTRTLIKGCEFRPHGRHSVYLIGSKGNKVQGNTFYVSALEAIAVRAFSDNLIEDNDFIGVVGVETHAITLTQPPSGQSYKINQLKIKNNRAYDLRGAFFYGQGNGTKMYDSVVSGNTASQALDYTGTDHVFMFYRTERCYLSNNTIGFSRNRGVQLYGCKDNDLSRTTTKNTNDVGATAGAILLASYTDPIEAVETFSTGNILSSCKFIDDRTTQKHVYAIQMLAGNNKNIVSRNTYIGGSATRISSADGLSSQCIGENTDKFLFSLSSMATGTNLAANMKYIGDNSLAYTSQDSFIKSFRIAVQQITITGTATARLYENGVALASIVFTADNTSRTMVSYYQPSQYSVGLGDTLNVQIETASLTSGQPSLSFLVEIVLAQ